MGDGPGKGQYRLARGNEESIFAKMQNTMSNIWSVRGGKRNGKNKKGEKRPLSIQGSSYKDKGIAAKRVIPKMRGNTRMGYGKRVDSRGKKTTELHDRGY